jgi:O-antigen/teichoic acid export membrane protein
VIYIALAKFYFMIAGAIIEFRLPAVLANAVFGAYAVVSSVVSPINNVLITGTIQSVSRFTAQRPELAHAIQRAGFRMHLWVGLPVALLFIASAPLTARFFHDTAKTGPLMLAGCIVAAYSFYAVFIGTANGRRQFSRQAGLDVSFATLRAIGIVGLSTLGLGLYGALSGWVGASLVILVLAALVVGLPRRDGAAQPVKPMIAFLVGVGIYLLLLNQLMVIDQVLLKRYTTRWFLERQDALRDFIHAVSRPPLASGLAHDVTPMAAADGQVGFYRAVQNLARLSYQAIIAATFVIFPLISRTTFADDREATRRYIQTTLRYSLIFASLIGVVFAANPRELLDIPYRDDYALMGATALVALALGNVAFSVFAIIGTILNGAGLTGTAILCAAVTLALAAAANLLVMPYFGPGAGLLCACAVATSAAMLFGAALGGWFLARRLGGFLPVMTVLRVAIAAAAAIAAGQLLPWTGALLCLAEAALVASIFLATLLLTGELRPAELGAVRRILTRRRGAAR